MARQKETQTKPWVDAIEGYRLTGVSQVPYLGIELSDMGFRQYPSEPGVWYVEARARIGTIDGYVLVLTIDQALAADIIERV